MADVSTPVDGAMVQVPQTLSAWLDPLSTGLLLLVVVWAVLALIGWYQRRSYNLTAVDQAAAKRTQADFLKVDHDAREDALARGDAYVEQREREAADESPLPPEQQAAPAKTGVGRFSQVARIGAVLFAMVNVVVVGAGALMRAEGTHQFFSQLSDWQRWQVLWENYWIGLLVAVLVILLQLFYLARAVAGGKRR